MQEPHIDEELSDAEEDNSSENGHEPVEEAACASHSNFEHEVEYVNHEEQTEAVDEDES